MEKEIMTTDLVTSEKVLSKSDSTIVPRDKNVERKLLLKIDLLILPILFLFYMLSYLDRINIGNARIQGMSEELDLHVENRYDVALFESPLCAQALSKLIRLYTLRVLLGFFEAGLVPGVVYVTSMYYCRYEYQERLSLMFFDTSVGGAIGGREKELLHLRLAGNGGEFRMDTFDRPAVKQIFLDWKIWLGSLIYMSSTSSGLAMSFFLLTVLKEYDWRSAEA
ncbi:hypothetical protein N7495_002595 [Penicillium taxi]|uniref:uncharacterized protein n=1 Tax=Penicillium taxi TaxID=168475 RepID=UPI002545323B|nr:uncharacterized protein N7495_002595 [Penicillium taxi]KAJ5902067.1 hypothetical protein N7495_002595 [Penicillium taxi]